DRERVSVAFSLDALERDPEAEIAVLGSPFVSQVVEAIRARAAWLSLGLISSPLSRREGGTGGEDLRERGDEAVELPMPVRAGGGARGDAPRRGGAGARRRARQAGPLLRVGLEGAGRRGGARDGLGAGRAPPRGRDPTQPGEGGRAPAAARRGRRADATRRVAARVRAGAARDVRGAAVLQRVLGLVARVSALWPPARHAGDLPARPLRLRGLLAPLLSVRRGLLYGPRDRRVPGGRPAGVRRARAGVPVLPAGALHRSRRRVRRRRPRGVLGVSRALRQLRPRGLQPACAAQPRRRPEGEPPPVRGVYPVLR